MQFFPGAIADLFSAGGSNLPGKNAVFNKNGGFYSPNGIKEALPVFGEIFNNLAEFNEANTPGPSLNFRSVREDRSRIKSADLGLLKEKLAEKGVAEPTLDRFMEQLGALFYAPTVGNMRSAAQKLIERQSPPLNEQETLAFSSLLNRMGFEPEAVELMQEAAFAGDGKKILQSIREALAENPDKLTGHKVGDPAFVKAVENAPLNHTPSTLPVRPYQSETVQKPGTKQARVLTAAFAPASTSVPSTNSVRQATGENHGSTQALAFVPAASPSPQAADKNRVLTPDASGKIATASFSLSKEEAALLCRAADLSAANEQKIMQAFGAEKTELPLDRDLFSQVFGPALEEKTRLQAENIRLNEVLPTAIRDMFAHKTPEQLLPSGDNKSSRRAEHTQIMAREKATSVNEDTKETQDPKHDAPISRRRSIVLHMKGGAENPPPAAPKPSGRDASEAPRPLVQVQPQVQTQSQNQLQAQTQVQLQLQQAETAKTSKSSPARGNGRAEQIARPAPAEPLAQAVAAQPLKQVETDEQENPMSVLTEKREKDAFKPVHGPAERQSRGQEDQNQLGRPLHQDEASNLHTARPAFKAQGNAAIQEGIKHPQMESALDEAPVEDTPAKGKAAPKSRAEENAPQLTREVTRLHTGTEKTEARAEAVLNQFLPQAENSAAGTETAKLSLHQRQEIFEQVENGLVRSLHDGGKQIILRLDPPELGKLILSLTVAQGEVRAVIRAESPAAAQAVSEQLAQLKASLEEQGFKVSSLEVETRTPSHAGTEHWDGTEQHNQRQELREQAGFLRLAQFRGREAETLVRTVQSEEQAASYSASGLHIIA